METVFFDKVIIRTPAYPFEYFKLLTGDEETFLSRFASDEVYRNAIYLASPELYELLQKKDFLEEVNSGSKKARKLRNSLLKYAYRMSTRCTPFGLFAGTSVLNLSSQTSIKLQSREFYKQHSRLDMDFLGSFLSHLNSHPSVKLYLKYYVNSSLYTLGDTYRYIEYTLENNVRKYELTSVDNNYYLTKVIDSISGGMLINEIVECVTDQDVSEEEATEFIEYLIESQILMSEMEPATTGDEMGAQINFLLKEVCTRITNQDHLIFINTISDYYSNLLDELARIDQLNCGDKVPYYEEFKVKIKQLGISFNSQFLIQNDLTTSFSSSSISTAILTDVKKGIEILSKLTPHKRVNKNLEKFKEAFLNKYDMRAVPLVEALDVESGIGYGGSSEENQKDISTIVNNLFFDSIASGIEQVEWNDKLHDFWIKKISQAYKEQSDTIILQDSELDGFPSQSQYLPATGFVGITLLQNDKDGHHFFLKGCAGPTAATWLGRFCHVNESVRELCDDVVAAEEWFHEGKIVAEVAHLPQARIGNVLQRPTLRKYEIAYLAKGSVSTEFNIPLSDLMLVVENGSLILFSKTHQKEIVPYLTTAHIYSQNALPIYHFLGDLQQHNGNDGFYIDLGIIPRSFNFIPRIAYKNIILRKATWSFLRGELDDIIKCNENDWVERFNVFALRYNIPKLFSISNSDNELVIDRSSTRSLDVFFQEIRTKDSIIVSECLLDQFYYPVIDDAGQRFNNEILFFFQNKKRAPYLNNIAKRCSPNEVSRQFIPGGHWCYIKIYTGFKFADNLLLSLGPVINKLLNSGTIDKWFYLRYQDPKFHLRIRFHQPELGREGEILGQLYPLLAELEKKGLVWKVVLDTYQRELERYGFNTIEEAESIFFYDSAACLAILKSTQEAGDENLTWLSALYSTDKYFELFDVPMSERKSISEVMRDGFIKEFSISKVSNKFLEPKFREAKQEINSVLRGGLVSENKLLCMQLQELDLRNQIIAPIVGNIIIREPELARSILTSLIHMNYNRLFRSQQRLYEFVGYDFLKRFYSSAIYDRQSN